MSKVSVPLKGHYHWGRNNGNFCRKQCRILGTLLLNIVTKAICMALEFYYILVCLFLLARGCLFVLSQRFKDFYWVILSVFHSTNKMQICVDTYQPEVWL